MFNKLKTIPVEYLGLSTGILYGAIVLFIYFVVYPAAKDSFYIYVVPIIIATVFATLFIAWNDLRLKNKLKLSSGLSNTISGLFIIIDVFLLILIFQRYEVEYVLYALVIAILAFFGTLTLSFSILKSDEFKSHEEHFKYDNL